jgi:sterol desaturase/sphingolipid hydroxylase (fatty acid hydroxylase superfamily)
MDPAYYQLAIEWLLTKADAIIVLCVYALGFYVLSLFLAEPTQSTKEENFSKVHSDRSMFYKEFNLEIGYFLINLFVTSLFITFITATLALIVLPAIAPHRIFAVELESWPYEIQFMLGLLMADIAFFIPHWLVHRFMWRFHAIHHAAKELRWLTSIRLHPVDAVMFSACGYVISYFIGFDGHAVLLAITVHNIYNFFVHTNINLAYPAPVRYIFVSPNYHRWHHATDKAAVNKNIATMFSFLDLICGSYYHPEGKLPKSYGIARSSPESALPKTFWAQIFYPFRIRKKSAAKKTKQN